MRLLPHVHKFENDCDDDDPHPLYRCGCGRVTNWKAFAIELQRRTEGWFAIALIAWLFGIVIAIVLIAQLWEWSWS